MEEESKNNNYCHCGKQTMGHKCSNKDCGAKSEQHDPEHKHEGMNTCEPCCTGCDEAKSNCNCGEMSTSL